jgi:glutamine amidotransferase
MKQKKIVIIDYGIGNIESMSNAIYKIGQKSIVSSSRKEILEADFLILPGVGAFTKGMENLIQNEINVSILEFVKLGKPLLGVCLGMQMLLEESEEFGKTKGLGLIKGKVVKFPKFENAQTKVPHIGWNKIIQPNYCNWEGTILNEIENENDLYFVHSYISVPQENENVLSTSIYGGIEFCSAVRFENIYGTQFHPEKSSKIGLTILNNFVNLK